jgi:hypothetical protein
MTWREAAKKTIVSPISDRYDNYYFRVNCAARYNAMNVMTRALPNLQQIDLGYLGHEHKYNDGEDPHEEEAARTAHRTTHDIEIISNFSKLRILDIHHTGMNGRYPVLFNSFPLLQNLRIEQCEHLKWDLDMLAGFPLLKALYCSFSCLTGNINSLRVLKYSLEKVSISSHNVEGNLMDLADFPHLKELNLAWSAVKGDIRDIGENDFSSLKELDLPKGVYGGAGCEFERISDGPDLIRAICLLNEQRQTRDILMSSWYGELSWHSPDWYDSADELNTDDTPPFSVCFVRAGSRLGYRWETIGENNPCEVNWLDPEPDKESSNYEEYIIEWARLKKRVGIYKGFYQPPTEEEYRRLVERIMRSRRFQEIE